MYNHTIIHTNVQLYAYVCSNDRIHGKLYVCMIVCMYASTVVSVWLYTCKDVCVYNYMHTSSMIVCACLLYVRLHVCFHDCMHYTIEGILIMCICIHMYVCRIVCICMFDQRIVCLCFM